MAETGEDCHFFMTTGCTKGAECGFRHSSAAKDNEKVCRHWLAFNCTKLGCTFRHPTRPAAAPMAAAAPMMGLFGAANPGGNVCSFFLKGQCKKGANCSFSHSVMDPLQMQLQFLQQQQQLFLQQQMQQQQQQQQQHHDHQGFEGNSNSGRRREKKERPEKAQKEKRPLTEAEKEALLSKPLASGTQSKRFKEDKKEEKKQPVAVVSAPNRAAAPKKTVEKTSTPSSGAVQIKTLAQIMAEKNSKGGSGGGGGGEKKASEKKAQQDVNDELLALGLDPKDLEGFGDGDGDVDIVI